jgi:tRNA A-37 threonylcarbamoyl transferase component Bud32
MSPENKLRIGYQVATAIGNLHSFDGDMPSVTHNDLCCHQFILIDGVYKLNDFHLAETLKKDREGNACVDRPKGMNPNVRISSRTLLYSLQGGIVF